jgi:hypothetical protein
MSYLRRKDPFKFIVSAISNTTFLPDVKRRCCSLYEAKNVFDSLKITNLYKTIELKEIEKPIIYCKWELSQ